MMFGTNFAKSQQNNNKLSLKKMSLYCLLFAIFFVTSFCFEIPDDAVVIYWLGLCWAFNVYWYISRLHSDLTSLMKQIDRLSFLDFP